MWRGAQALPADGRQSETALMIARGVRRLLRARGFSSLTELPLTDGRRADIAAVNRDGDVLIVEIKSSPADFRADRKWRDYAACCDRLYFAISERTPADLMPLEAGLIVADTYGAEIVREAELGAWRPRAGARSCCASPGPPRTGCTAWPIRRPFWTRARGDRAEPAAAVIASARIRSGRKPSREARPQLLTRRVPARPSPRALALRTPSGRGRLLERVGKRTPSFEKVATKSKTCSVPDRAGLRDFPG